MIKIEIDEEEIKKIIKEQVRQQLEKEIESLMIDVNDLCKMVNMSRPTVEKLFIYNSKFPAIRVGKKWLFYRKEVEKYIEEWFKEVRKNGGSIDI
jgi:excisionase family DNA binding protein